MEKLMAERIDKRLEKLKNRTSPIEIEVSRDNELLTKDGDPIAWGKKIENGQLVVDCPFDINHEHLHGVGEGGRVPHCSGGDYYVIKFTNELLSEL